MGIVVQQVSSRRDMRRFIRFPLRLYAGDPLFVPHLISERRRFFSRRNPIFESTDVSYFLACDGAGSVVGRVTAHVNHRHNEYVGERAGFFGFLESVEDLSVAEALMGAVENRLRRRGMRAVRGPFNFSTNEECGLLARGFDLPPVIMMPYTKRYYLDFMSRLGYAKARDLLAYYYDSGGSIPGYMSRFSRRAESRSGVNVRRVDMRNFEADVRAAFSVYNSAWADNWGFVPMTDAQFRYLARELRPIIDPALALIAEVDGRPVGFSLGLPDYNPVLRRMKGRLFPLGIVHFLLGRRRIDAARIITLGVVPEHRKKGIEILLTHRTFQNGLARGYWRGEFSWVLEENVLLRRMLERFGAEHRKTYRIFEKGL
ncbi:MAG: N-acetyltransferase [Planctomycetota bacterium]|jgi:GNAT superfamily N-acetyltransferase